MVSATCQIVSDVAKKVYYGVRKVSDGLGKASDSLGKVLYIRVFLFTGIWSSGRFFEWCILPGEGLF